MRFRKLRIAWSALWLLASVLLIAMWVRSCWWGEAYNIQINKFLYGCSYLRGCIVLTCHDPIANPDFTAGYSWGPAPGQRIDKHFPVQFYGFYFTKMSDGFGLVVPIWFLMVASIGWAVAPWLNWRQFSLRTLLIATMLIAAMMGLSVWLSK
jgi:hypothetical protein